MTEHEKQIAGLRREIKHAEKVAAKRLREIIAWDSWARDLLWQTGMDDPPASDGALRRAIERRTKAKR